MMALLMYFFSSKEHTMDFHNIFEGLHGPGRFRFIVQPLIAIFLGFRDGKVDATLGRSPYLLNILTSTHHRGSVIKDGLMSIIKPIILAWCMDTAFQIFVLGSWSPFQATLVGVLLVALPYILIRGMTNRTLTRAGHHGP
jgi:hypothetical protein